MSTFEHSRFRIINPAQHPYRHSMGDFAYTNARLPGVTNPNDALDYIIAVLYPNYIGTYDTPGDLPGGASANDYAIVTDDGDGKSAGYIYTVIDGVSAWSKRYDVDWSLESILAEAVNRTLPMYVQREGFNQKDAAGTEIAGTYAGQKIFGGTTANTNLTFNANSFDTTGYVQTDNTLRPTSDNALDMGTATERWRTIYAKTSVILDTMTLSTGSILDSTGGISFGAVDLTTTGTLAAGDGDFTTTVDAGTLTIGSGSITDSSGSIDFGNENLGTTGFAYTGKLTVLSDMVIELGKITSSSGAITFDNENLSTSGTLGAGSTTVTDLKAGNVIVAQTANTISNFAIGPLNLGGGNTSQVNVNSTLYTGQQQVTGNVYITGLLDVDNILIDGNTISSTDVNGNIVLDPNGTGLVEVASGFYPSPSSSLDLGKTGNVWNKFWIDGSIGAATEITIADLLTLRSTPYRDLARTQPAQAGDTLFWDAVNGLWLANHPDTEITHSEISGLTTTDAGHTQFVMLAGRAGGQTVQGGTAASELLVLESTANVTKGTVQVKDSFLPFTNASYSGGWAGIDLGGSSNYYRDLYTKGELKGARIENYTDATIPVSSSQNIGRLAYATDTKRIYVDNGSAFQVASIEKFVEDTVWNGSDTTKTVTVSASINDARLALWGLLDNSNDFERMFVPIDAISATQVRIDVGYALPAGSYRLIGIA